MDHLATILLQTIEQPLPVLHFTGAFLKQWPQGIRQALHSAQLLHRGGVEQQIQCDWCADACLADIQWQATGAGDSRPYIRCRQPGGWGRIPLEPDEIESWHTSFAHLAYAVAGFLEFPAPREEVILERLWWLGGKTIERRDVDLFLARGAHWSDAPQVFMRNGRVRECTAPLILVPHEVPVTSPFPTAAPVRSLATLLCCEETHLQLRHEQLAGTVRQMSTERQQVVIPIPTAPGTAWTQVMIEFANEEVVQIHVGNDRHSRTFAEMGFDDLRKPVSTPSELWAHFRTLAKFEGRIGWDTPGAVTEKDRNKVSKWMSGIRQRLQAVFPDIAGDPFEPYKKVKAYQVKCVLRLWNG